MIIIEPVALTDVTCTRAATATYYDRNGVQQTAPANTLRVTYNPADLTRAPYALLDAGEVIGTNAGLVYSNVAITETAYSASVTYAKSANVYDPATYSMYQSLIASNLGKALTDTTAWTPLSTSVNRWMMFDAYNNTQTTNAEEILIVLSPRAISQGAYLGNIDANEVRVSVVDLIEGLVYQEVQNLVVPNSSSSFFNWSFKRINRRDYAVSVRLPPYSNALATIAIKKPGGIAKCGVCAVGAVVDVGLSQYGLSREIKDYSTVDFRFDGTSNLVLRNFAKLMSADVTIQNDNIDTVISELEKYRQKPLVWLGTTTYGSTCLFGTYTSFKNVITYPTESTMSLQLQGTV